MKRFYFKQWALIVFATLACLIPSHHFDPSSALLASTEVVEFSRPELRERYYNLIQELRCPKCQNQNLADSNAPISTDMKTQIHKMLEQQMSDADIKAYLVSRYSEFILYRPSVNQQTWFLWWAPGVLLVITLIIMRRQYQLRAASDTANKSLSSNQLNTEQQQRLSELLNRGDEQS